VTLTPDDLRAKIAESKKPKASRKQWSPPLLSDLAEGHVLAFDQTLSNTGMAWVINDKQGLRAIDCANLKPPTDIYKGHEGSIRKGLWLQYTFQRLRGECAGRNAQEIVYEQPAVMGYRIESSLMAAFALRLAWPTAEGIYNQHAKAIFLGSGQHTKADVKACINSYIPNWQRTGPWNEHVRDAVLLGMTYLYDQKKEQS